MFTFFARWYIINNNSMKKKCLIKRIKGKVSIFKGMPNVLLPEICKLHPYLINIDFDGIDKVMSELDDINYDLVDEKYRDILDDFYTLLGDGAEYSNVEVDESNEIQNSTEKTKELETYEDIIKRAKISKIPTINESFQQTPSEEFVSRLDNNFIEDDYSGTLLLAQSSSLDSCDTNLIITIKGYLEVHSPYGVIRKSQFDSNDPLAVVLIPEKDIFNYHLKNGDQLSCTCVGIGKGKYIFRNMLTINGQKASQWKKFRPVFNDISAKPLKRKVKVEGCLKDPVNRFGLFKGDNVFMYMGKNSPKHMVVEDIIYNLAMVFDKIVYINPSCKEFIPINDDIARFCTKFDESSVNQIHTALLGINYAKRLVEQGLSVAVVVDDLNALAVLDAYIKNDMIISKTILSSNKDTDSGSLTLFNIMPYVQANSTVGNMHELFKTMQTLALVFDNQYVNLYDSNRM